jgi:hypothetical protein
VTIFTGKMMMNPGNTCCFRIIFRYRTRHFHFATSPSAPVPSAAPSQLTHPVGSLERPARSTRAVSAAALNYLPLVRADHSTAKVLQLEVGFGRPLTIYWLYLLYLLYLYHLTSGSHRIHLKNQLGHKWAINCHWIPNFHNQPLPKNPALFSSSIWRPKSPNPGSHFPT